MNASTAGWLDRVPSLGSDHLVEAQSASRALLDALAMDRELLTRLVDELPAAPERLANCRVTLLLNRLCLYMAPDRGFEIRMNMNPRLANQLVPHDHCYNFAARILRGGYVHVVRRRTDGLNGPFTRADVEPAIVTVERPGSAYTLGHQTVHQAVMEADTVTLFVRGPRLKCVSNTAVELMPAKENWPAPAEPGQEAAESRPATLDEFRMMRSYLSQRGLIG